METENKPDANNDVPTNGLCNFEFEDTMAEKQNKSLKKRIKTSQISHCYKLPYLFLLIALIISGIAVGMYLTREKEMKKKSLSTIEDIQKIQIEKHLAHSTAVTPQINSGFAGYDGTIVSVFNVQWDSISDGCGVKYPGFVASCPVGVILMSPAIENGEYHNGCSLTSDRTIECTKTFGESVVLACFGESLEDVQVEVSLAQDKAYCSELKREGFIGSYVYGVYGGESSQYVLLQQFCNGKHSFVDTICSPTSSLRTVSNDDGVPFEFCQIKGSCEDTKMCGCSYGWCSCSGEEYCYANVPAVSAVVTTSDENANACTMEFALSLDDGESCQYNVMCNSNLCIDGKCRNEALNNKVSCREDNDCKGSSCGRATLEDTSTTCCPSGNSIEHERKKYCTGQLPGASCISNEMCMSDICIFGICHSERLNDTLLCEEDLDCKSNACAIYYENTIGCCPSGRKIQYKDQMVCTELPPQTTCGYNNMCGSKVCVFGKCNGGLLEDNELCEEDIDCQSGKCGSQTYEEFASQICCPLGKAYSLKTSWNSKNIWFCGELEEGSVCGSNNMCKSKICIEEKCEEKTILDGARCEESVDCASSVCGKEMFEEFAINICCPLGKGYYLQNTWDNKKEWFCGEIDEGSACGSNNMCKSKICHNDECQSKKIIAGEPCHESQDCISGVCGFQSYENTAIEVCCDKAYYLGKKWYCGDLDDSSKCGDHNMCKSNICIGGECRSDKLGDGELCANNFDCLNGSCALETYQETASSVCCSLGKSIYLDVPWSYSDKWFCGNLDKGRSCGSNGMCKSQLCIGGECQSQKLQDGESCNKNSDCISGSCALNSYEETAFQVCCPMGRVLRSKVPWTYSDKWFCGDLDTMVNCGSNSMCKSHMCIGGQCQSQKLQDGDPCDESLDCLSGTCALKTYESSATNICCPNGKAYYFKIDWGYGSKYFCGNLDEGERCAHGNMCKSKICVSNKCAEKRLDDFEQCQKNTDCINQVCAKETDQEGSGAICCAEGKTSSIKVTWTYRNQIVCDSTDSSSSAINKSDFESCTSNIECTNGACAMEYFAQNAPSICCRMGEQYLLDVSWSYKDYYFCGGLGINKKCGHNLQCMSGTCINGICQEKRLNDLESCTESADCINGACAMEYFAQNAPSICCRMGEQYLLDVLWSYKDYYFCGGLEINKKCGHNLQCASGICIKGTCQKEQLNDLEFCTENSNCASGTCAMKNYEKNSPKVCCKMGEQYYLGVSWTYSKYHFCGGLEIGEKCGNNAQCVSGKCIGGICQQERLKDMESCTESADCISGACAMKSYEQNSPKVCCVKGVYFLLDVSWSYKDYYFCGGLQIKEKCGRDTQCNSGMCINGVCQEVRLDDHEPCLHSADCASGACAMKTFEKSAPSVCCENGEMYYMDVPWTYRDYWFCGGLKIGEKCGSNLQCTSGICIAGTCQQQRLSYLEPCAENADCVSGICAKENFDQKAPYICCKVHEAYVLDVPWTYKDYYFCGSLATNDKCGSNLQCLSGICVGGICKDERQADWDSCSENADCTSGICAGDEYKKTFNKVCCAGGEQHLIDVPWTYKDYYFCGKLPPGKLCHNDEMCKSKSCNASSRCN